MSGMSSPSFAYMDMQVDPLYPAMRTGMGSLGCAESGNPDALDGEPPPLEVLVERVIPCVASYSSADRV